MSKEQELLGMLMGVSELNEVRENYLRLPFGYPGSKAAELPKILPYLPYTNMYGEAFGGSGVVLLNRQPSKLEIFNDRYSGVTSFFRVIRQPELRDKLIERLACTLHSREEFIWCKSTWKDCDDDIERAARWYYTIRYAVNSKPNSTFGRSLKAKSNFAQKLPISLSLFFPVSVRLEQVQIENLDWRLCLSDYDQEGFVWYLDPTYLGVQKTYEFELSKEDHIELCERIQSLKGYVALSAYDNDITNQIYEKYKWKQKICWTRMTRASTLAFNEENNHVGLEFAKDRTAENHVKEALWIKDFS